MKVDPTKTPGAGAEGAPVQRSRVGQSARAVSGPSTPSRAVAPSGDDLVLSSRAEEFRKVRGRIDELPAAASSRRLAELREAVANGTYRIDAMRVAEAVLRDDIAGPLLDQADQVSE